MTEFPASQMAEAGTLVRLLLTFRAYGAGHVLVYSHMSNQEGGGGEFSEMGLRNDLPPDLEKPLGTPCADATGSGVLASHRAWPKAAWWAFQRLMTLTANAKDVEVVHNEAGFVALRLTAKAIGFEGPGGSRFTPASRWKYGFVFWLDSIADGDQNRVESATVRLTAPDGFERWALVPADTAWGGDGAPYAESTAPDWDEPGVGSRFGHCSQSSVQAGSFVSVTVYQTHELAPVIGMRNLGLVVWLTNNPGCVVA
jgi:hypothetical protein